MRREINVVDTDQLFGALGIGAYLTETGREGRVIDCNQALCELLGYAIGELRGMKVRDLYLVGGDRDVMESEILRAGLIRNKLVRLRRKDGSICHAEISAVGEVGPTGAVERYHGTLIDASHSIDMFHDIAHQLQTPLLSIQSCLLRLIDGSDPRKAQLLLRSARASAKIGLFLTRNLGFMSQTLEHTPESFADRLVMGSLSPLVHGLVLDMQEFAMQQNAIRIRAVSETIDPLPEIMLDEQVLTMALYCLLDNAIKYSYEDTTVLVQGRATKRNVHLEIQNEGLDLTGRDLKIIFLRGERTDLAKATVATGSGLGLYFVSQIMELIGGKVIAEPTVNSKTIFRLMFPIPGAPRKTA